MREIIGKFPETPRNFNKNIDNFIGTIYNVLLRCPGFPGVCLPYTPLRRNMYAIM
jgi:hypothetical protein